MRLSILVLALVEIGRGQDSFSPFDLELLVRSVNDELESFVDPLVENNIQQRTQDSNRQMELR